MMSRCLNSGQMTNCRKKKKNCRHYANQNHKDCQPHQSVFPIRMGVFLYWQRFMVYRLSLPHTHGGVSIAHGLRGANGTSSPYAWGCFSLHNHKAKRKHVFPIRMGVFPDDETCQAVGGSLPHTHGGVSYEQRKNVIKENT